MPMLIYQQPSCLYYAATSALFLNAQVGQGRGLNFSLSAPTFFIPTS